MTRLLSNTDSADCYFKDWHGRMVQLLPQQTDRAVYHLLALLFVSAAWDYCQLAQGVVRWRGDASFIIFRTKPLNHSLFKVEGFAPSDGLCLFNSVLRIDPACSNSAEVLEDCHATGHFGSSLLEDCSATRLSCYIPPRKNLPEKRSKCRDESDNHMISLGIGSYLPATLRD